MLLVHRVPAGVALVLACSGPGCSRVHSRNTAMCELPALGDHSRQPLDDLVVPDKLPSFGLTERENLRMRYMQLRDEPLLYEVFGLQIFVGMIGSKAGFFGFLSGASQLGPALSFMPGRGGHLLRAAGWHTFMSMIKMFELVVRVCKSVRERWLTTRNSYRAAGELLPAAS